MQILGSETQLFMKDKLSLLLYRSWTFSVVCIVWAILECPKWDVSICLQLPVTVVHALHSWILCNCKGPLLNSVPGNLIFTAAPDRNHLAVLIRLYWNWKIAAAVYIVLNSISSLELLVVWFMSLSHFFEQLWKVEEVLQIDVSLPKTSPTVWNIICLGGKMILSWG